MPKPLLALLVSVVLMACGGRTDPGTDGDSSAPVSTSGGGEDAAGGAPSTDGNAYFPICPPEPPEEGGPCSTPNQGCAYFMGGPCVSFTCSSSSVWTVSTPSGC
jgi:hypothetical protein